MATREGQNFDMWTGDYHALEFTVSGITPASSVSAAQWLMDLGNGNSLVKTDSDQTDPITVTDIGSTGLILVTVVIQEDETIGMEGLHKHQLRLWDSDNHPATVAVGNALIYPSIEEGS